MRVRKNTMRGVSVRRKACGKRSETHSIQNVSEAVLNRKAYGAISTFSFWIARV